MKLRDVCWRLGRFDGVSKTTVVDCTRGDSTCDEFFATEREAHLADAERCDAEAARKYAEALSWTEKAKRARKAAEEAGER